MISITMWAIPLSLALAIIGILIICIPFYPPGMDVSSPGSIASILIGMSLLYIGIVMGSYETYKKRVIY